MPKEYIMNESVKLIECFRNTWQGEGIDSGQRFTLLRFKYCNKKCSFCDTLVKMRISQESEYKISDIQQILDEERTNLMITGGEPTIDRHFKDTVSLLNNLQYSVANVETNGYALINLLLHVHKDKLVKYIYSPKIFKDDELREEKEKTNYLIKYDNVFIKLVYEDRKLIVKYMDWLSDLSKDYLPNKVWLMPEGTTRVDLIRNSEEVFNACEKYKFNFSSRSHIIFGFV